MKIEVKDASTIINKKTIFSNISFTVESGELVAIIGPSGCGKTTLLNCLGLVQTISEGSIFIDGKDTTKWTDKRRTDFWHDYAAFIYQDYGIIEDENVVYNLTLSKRKSYNSDIRDILKKVGLKNREKDLASILSGGEKQRLGIARAVFKNASVIYADEPTASLDLANRKIIMKLLRQFAETGAIVIIATHDESLLDVCDKVIEMK